MSITNALASVAVNDLNSAVQWYEQVLGKPPDSRPMAEVAEWKFERGGWRRAGHTEANHLLLERAPSRIGVYAVVRHELPPGLPAGREGIVGMKFTHKKWTSGHGVPN